MTIHDKYRVLQENLKALGSVAVAFSSGVDSTFLLKAAQEALGDKVIAVTASSCSFPKRELEEAKAFCEKNGIRQIIVESEELISTVFARIRRTVVICANTNCLRKSGRLRRRTA